MVTFRLVFMLVILDFSRVNMGVHKALKILREKMDLQHFCGYVTMLNSSSQQVVRKLSDASDGKGWWTIYLGYWACQLVALEFMCNERPQNRTTLCWASARNCGVRRLQSYSGVYAGCSHCLLWEWSIVWKQGHLLWVIPTVFIL